MSGLENALFNLKFTAKSLNRQALKAGKEEQAEKTKLEKVDNMLPTPKTLY
jgi:charged multivesicular body protein 1